jgi:2-polyprenyl-3-methyl-5-hydroxy-6-metoxy-1,4-benzoquinol methylase
VQSRKFVLDTVDRDGAFLDVGCANGYLMECIPGWAAEKGLAVEPHGVDIVPEFVALPCATTTSARAWSTCRPTAAGSS